LPRLNASQHVSTQCELSVQASGCSVFFAVLISNSQRLPDQHSSAQIDQCFSDSRDFIPSPSIATNFGFRFRIRINSRLRSFRRCLRFLSSRFCFRVSTTNFPNDYRTPHSASLHASLTIATAAAENLLPSFFIRFSIFSMQSGGHRTGL